MEREEVIGPDADPASVDGTPDGPDLETGRYLYCVVDLSAAESDPASLEFDGIEGETAYVVGTEGLGVVVHPCETLYDSEDLRQLHEWLLSHQQVIDDAGDAFGTPLPFQFDTILDGDDDAVRGWLSETADQLEESLSTFAGKWEYRVELSWDPEQLTDLILESDPEIEQLQPDDSATEGTSFLQEKQYEQAVTSAREDRRETLARNVRDELEEHVSALVRISQSTASDIETERKQGFARFSILASDEAVDSVGEILDDVAETSGVTVRFTGPWPPYTFAPELGDGT